MESKLNLEAASKYSEEFSKIICDRFFATEDKINGDQILNLTNIPQVNLFVIRNLLLTWQQESIKLRSPYFDYSSKEVRKSLADFLNVLSMHISIGKKEFQPLLKLACLKTIQVLYAPYDFFMRQITRNERGKISMSELKLAGKYIKINNQFYQALLESFENTGKSEFSNEEAKQILEEVFTHYSGTPEEGEKYLIQFSKVLEFKLEDIFSEARKPKEAVNASRPQTATLNEAHSGKIKETLGDALKKISKNKLKESISVNQRFMFVQVLFQGDNNRFEEVLSSIDGLSSKQEVLQFLEEEVLRVHDWDKEAEEVSEFYELVLTRFD